MYELDFIFSMAICTVVSAKGFVRCWPAFVFNVLYLVLTLPPLICTFHLRRILLGQRYMEGLGSSGYDKANRR